LCGQRERHSTASGAHRNEFDKDYDRIVYSSSFRRLQDKAQLFPLQENDFIRTRLTHSIEASALARSLGTAIGQWLIEKEEMNIKQASELASLLQVAALVHDLGNPPFGHYGEDIIRNWFRKWFETQEFKEINSQVDKELSLTEKEKKDFINFEGNAQTIRILTKLQLLNDQYGVNFTYGTLAATMKYPWASDNPMADCKGKFGYFQAEADIIKRIYEYTGLVEGVRHPATFLLEAADDMAYLCADIEDAVKKCVIPWEKEYNNIKDKLLKKDYKTYKDMFEYIDNKNVENKLNKIPDCQLSSIQNFKIMAQVLMFNKVVEVFKDKYDCIMNGEYGCNELLKEGTTLNLVEELERLKKEYCYVDKEVLALELVGDTVISGLLDMFVNNIAKCKSEPDPKIKEGKLYRIISDNFRYVCCNDYKKKRRKDFTEVRLYDKLLLITDFISGMTDSYAVNLYKELIGVKLP